MYLISALNILFSIFLNLITLCLENEILDFQSIKIMNLKRYLNRLNVWLYNSKDYFQCFFHEFHIFLTNIHLILFSLSIILLITIYIQYIFQILI
jgi:hypothetical protein